MIVIFSFPIFKLVAGEMSVPNFVRSSPRRYDPWEFSTWQCISPPKVESSDMKIFDSYTVAFIVGET